MKIKFIIPLLALVTIGSCDAQKKTKTAETKPAKTTKKSLLEPTKPSTKKMDGKEIVHLALGENIFLEDAQMNLTFKKIVQDSRCPAGTNCVWAGNATVEIEAMTTTSRPAKLQISVGDLRNNLKNYADFADYRISLENLNHEIPSGNNKDSAQNTSIILKVEKSTNQSASALSKSGNY